MTNPPTVSTPVPVTKPTTNRLSATADWIQYFVSLGVVVAVLAWMIFGPKHHAGEVKENSSSADTATPASVSSTGSIDVVAESPLGAKLELYLVELSDVRDPLLQVTGSVLASRRPGRHDAADYWQFNTSSLLETYSSWEKAQADITFMESQLKRVQELSVAKQSTLQRSIERLEKLVRVGTETERDLTTQRTDLMQTQIRDKKEIYETEIAVKAAIRQENAFALQLQQAGLETDLLNSAAADIDVVAADVPEGRLDRIAIGQSCIAHFYGLPDLKFDGKVATLSPVLSSEQRTLRVLFLLKDPEDQLRPGMFAEIGLGTDPRRVIRVPAPSVLHIGREDYVLVVESLATKDIKPSDPTALLRFRPRLVRVHELINGQVEIEQGLAEGDRIVARNSILLKPLVIRALSLQPASSTSKPGRRTP